ncbi:hypothetical protein [Cumulibacter soli]|uniref:hypothetical protein n=1 Tax=Cumulibacter soli TaxID=2546344 RepID=UPI001067D599|nr:hypothetical protein [Cumulibacter soli]
MSRFAEELTPTLPAGLSIPEPLERAFTWMEDQGWGLQNEHGYYMTPYAGEAQLGVVFTPSASLMGWFEPDEAGYDRLAPFVELDGSGGLGVLWLDDAGDIRIGALGSDGAVSLLADNAVDFLRLVAIGYDEVGEFIEGEPFEEESVEAHAEFRAWVEAEFGVEIPEHWSFPEPDPFNAWVNQVKGLEYRTYAF